MRRFDDEAIYPAATVSVGISDMVTSLLNCSIGPVAQTTASKGAHEQPLHKNFSLMLFSPQLWPWVQRRPPRLTLASLLLPSPTAPPCHDRMPLHLFIVLLLLSSFMLLLPPPLLLLLLLLLLLFSLLLIRHAGSFS
jgi:hypothetical protein